MSDNYKLAMDLVIPIEKLEFFQNVRTFKDNDENSVELFFRRKISLTDSKSTYNGHLAGTVDITLDIHGKLVSFNCRMPYVYLPEETNLSSNWLALTVFVTNTPKGLSYKYFATLEDESPRVVKLIQVSLRDEQRDIVTEVMNKLLNKAISSKLKDSVGIIKDTTI